VGENLPFGTDANHNPVTLNLTQTITNSAMETVDVPAGTFTNALKQVTTITEIRVKARRIVVVEDVAEVRAVVARPVTLTRLGSSLGRDLTWSLPRWCRWQERWVLTVPSRRLPASAGAVYTPPKELLGGLKFSN